MPRVVVVLGTRPELVKMADPVHVLRRSGRVDVLVVFTGQHAELLDQAASDLGIEPDVRIEPLPPGRSLTHVLAHVVQRLGRLLEDRPADCVVVQGDTVSVLAGALVAELMAIPLVHVEAGVRSKLRDDPFPEETIRRMISPISELHLPFTEAARRNLVDEGVDPRTIVVVPHPLKERVRPYLARRARDERPRVLLTLHRRERRRRRADTALELLGRIRGHDAAPAVSFTWHPTLESDVPELRGQLEDLGVEVLPPQHDADFLRLLGGASLVITDSVGVAEEAQLMCKPLLVLRTSVEVRFDEPPAAAWCATEDAEIGGEFVLRCLAEDAAGPEEPSLPTTAPPGVFMAREIEAFVLRERG